MLNVSGIKKVSAVAPNQILGNTSFQVSIGIIVQQDAGTLDDTTKRKIVKAGTPMKVDPSNLQTPATKSTAEEGNVVLLHDVDVTDGNANGTGLVMGIVNYNRLDSATQSLLPPGSSVAGVFCIAL